MDTFHAVRSLTDKIKSMMCYTISNFDIFSLKELNVSEIFMKFLKNVSKYLWVPGAGN